MRVWLKCGAEIAHRRRAKDAVGDTASAFTCILHWLKSIGARPPSLRSQCALGVCEIVLSSEQSALLFCTVPHFLSLEFRALGQRSTRRYLSELVTTIVSAQELSPRAHYETQEPIK